MSADGEERREHPRSPARFPLYVAMAGELFHKTVAVEARDLSSGGLAFDTRTAIAKDSRATVMLGKLEGLPTTAHIEASIVHCQPNPDGETFTVGVKFVRFVDVTAEDLMKRVSSLEPPAGQE